MTTLITKQDFLDKVFNYEASQEWDFAGERPAIIDFYNNQSLPKSNHRLRGC